MEGDVVEFMDLAVIKDYIFCGSCGISKAVTYVKTKGSTINVCIS